MVESVRRLLNLLARAAVAAGVLGLPCAARGDDAELRRATLRFHVRSISDVTRLHIVAREQPLQTQSVRLVPGRRSLPVEYQGPRRLTLYGDRLQAGESPELLVLGEVVLPAAREILVMLLPETPRAKGATAFRAVAIDDSAAALPVNHLVFLNLSGFRLGGRVGRREVVLNEGLSPVFALEELFGRADVLIAAWLPDGGAARLVLETRTRFLPGRRYVVVLLPSADSAGGPIDAYRIQEYVAPTPPER